MGNIAATLSLNVPAITSVCKGPRGSLIYTGPGVPSITVGVSGDYYIDVFTANLYGPKTNNWPVIPGLTLSFPSTANPYTIFNEITSIIVPRYGNNTLLPSSTGSSILGGTNNYIRGNRSAILGGTSNSLTANNSFIIGSNITWSQPNYTIVNNLSTPGTLYDGKGNSNSWNSVYTYAINASGSIDTVNTTFYGQSANNLSVYSSVNSNSARWSSAYTGYNAASSSFLTYSDRPTAFAYTQNIAVSAIRPQRGTNIADGCFSVVGGGICNESRECYSSVINGFSSRALGKYSLVGGGTYNTASEYSSVVVNGSYNTSTSRHSLVGAGIYNSASGMYSVVLGGYCQCGSGSYSMIGGGACNCTACLYTTVVGGSGNAALSSHSVIVGGSDNYACGVNSFIGGGCDNIARNNSSVVVGGYSNTACGCSSFVGGGRINSACGDRSVVVGGSNNTTLSGGEFSFIGGGVNNQASGSYSVIIGGCRNIASGTNSFIAGSGNDTRSFPNTFILGRALSADRANYTFVNNISSRIDMHAGGMTSTRSLSVFGPEISTTITNSLSVGKQINANDVTVYNNLDVTNNIYAGNNIGAGISTPVFHFDSNDSVVLDTTIGSRLSGLRLTGNTGTGNTESLEITNTRTSIGSNWNTAGWRLQEKVDVTHMGWIQFNGYGNPGGITFGVGQSPISPTSVPQKMQINTNGVGLTGNITGTGTISMGTPWSTKTNNYTIAESDCGSIISLSSLNPLILTIPNNDFRSGFQVTFMRGHSGAVSIAASTGVNLRRPLGMGTSLSFIWSVATVVYSGDPNVGWILFGDVV
jgi:hypothetical protein